MTFYRHLRKKFLVRASPPIYNIQVPEKISSLRGARPEKQKKKWWPKANVFQKILLIKVS
jgi:hypothetical protein